MQKDKPVDERKWGDKDLDISDIINLVAEGKMKLLSKSDLTKLLSVSRTTIERWMEEGSKVNLPRPDFKIGGKSRWSEYVIHRWLRSKIG